MMASVNTLLAGGLMTNTNYHIAFDRMFARGATFDIDAAYSNPAGLAWGHEGFQISLNFQRNIAVARAVTRSRFQSLSLGDFFYLSIY